MRISLDGIWAKIDSSYLKTLQNDFKLFGNFFRFIWYGVVVEEGVGFKMEEKATQNSSH